MTITVREFDRDRDRRGVEAIDTTFETSSVFDVVTAARSIELVERRLDVPISKRYEISDVFADWAQWDVGWVADDGEIRGFASVAYEPWHQRLTLWFLYVAPAWRRRGVGASLLARVEQHGRHVGATHVWLQTSNVNVPGVSAYYRLGYSLFGAERSAHMPGETVIYLAKLL